MTSSGTVRENQPRAHNEKVERSTRLAIAACRARYGTPEILSYESIDTILDAHPDFNEVKRVLADRREQVIAHIMRTGKDMSKKVSQFECFVTEYDYYRDMDNRDAQKEVSCRIKAESLNDLYEKLGQVKIRETPQEDRGDEYTEVEFGKIREIVIVSEIDVDDERLNATSACQKYAQQRKDAALKKQQALAEQAAKKEANELAELKRLQAKYPTIERSLP
ncbi:MAG: hypothetical protein ACYCS8_04710 [Acidithiobacillus sp.]